MKNKVFILLLVVFMVTVAAVGCRPEEAPPAPTEVPEETPQDTPETIDETPEAREVEYEDGTYRGELEVNEKGWTSVVDIVVEDGRITEVDYEELDEEENPKSENEEYNERWESVAGISAPEAYPALEQQLIETQDVQAIDVVTGATQTTRDFMDVVEDAFEKGPQ